MSGAGRSVTDFLFQRIRDDEDVAHDMSFQAGKGRPLVTLNGGGAGIRRLTDPLRILADCKAKRGVVSDLQNYGGVDPQMRMDILTLMAKVYADHPDYRTDWSE